MTYLRKRGYAWGGVVFLFSCWGTMYVETETGFGVFHTESLGNLYPQGNSLNFSMPKPSILGWVGIMHEFSFGQGLIKTLLPWGNQDKAGYGYWRTVVEVHIHGFQEHFLFALAKEISNTNLIITLRSTPQQHDSKLICCMLRMIRLVLVRF